jgi:hypothetical protein
MSLTRARPAQGRRARRSLDQARNPKLITHHAIQRFLQELHHDAERRARVFASPDRVVDTAREELRALCAAARRLHRGRNSLILESPPWFLFYRDQSVITVMHRESPRKW